MYMYIYIYILAYICVHKLGTTEVLWYHNEVYNYCRRSCCRGVRNGIITGSYSKQSRIYIYIYVHTFEYLYEQLTVHTLLLIVLIPLHTV